MTDSVLERFTSRHTAKGSESPQLVVSDTDPDQTDDCGAFGWLRGIRDKAIMLELRKKDGTVRAFGYAWLSQAEFDPSVGITLHIAGQTIKIAGRNLNAESRPNVRLFQGILRHRVSFVQEADEPTIMQAKDHDTVIERIDC